jgi:hypothetical protein
MGERAVNIRCIRRNEPWIVLAVGLAWCLAAVASHAQQPTPVEMRGVLSAKLGMAQQNIDQALLALTRAQDQNAKLIKELNDWKDYAHPLYEPSNKAAKR